MNESILQIKMLGSFSIRYGDRVISDDDDRSHKVWSLLAYLVCNRGRALPMSELTDLYWGEGAGSSDPENALKSIFHRIRVALDKLENGFGRQLILRKAGCYSWNCEVPAEVDTDRFEALCREAEAAEGGEAHFEACCAALKLYHGDLLEKLSHEEWVKPLSTHYHSLYLRIVTETVAQLDARERIEDMVALCRQAIRIDPFDENLYEHLLRGLLKTGDSKGVMAVYEEMSDRLFSNFGVMPSEPLRELYRQATRTVNDHALTLDELQEQLREDSAAGGAMLCEYDFFRILYRSEARAIVRTGAPVHICLLSVTTQDGSELPRRSLDPAMNNLCEILPAHLRKGDIITRCSLSQFLILLPQADREGSRKVAERLISAFHRRYPHSPAKLRCTVQPVKPTT